MSAAGSQQDVGESKCLGDVEEDKSSSTLALLAPVLLGAAAPPLPLVLNPDRILGVKKEN